MEEILLENIQEVIPSLLQKKLEQFGITKLSEVSALDKNEFKTRSGIGKKVVDQLNELLFLAQNHEDELVRIQFDNTKTHLLPINENVILQQNFLATLQELIVDYLNLKNVDKHKSVITHLYGLNKNAIFTTEEIASYHNISSQNVRNIKTLLLDEIRLLLNGERNENLRCEIREEFLLDYAIIQKELIEKKFFSKSDLLNTIRSSFFVDSHFNSNPALNVLIDLLDFTICGKVESNFTTAEIIIAKADSKIEFIKTANKVLEFLKKTIAPLNEMQVVIGVKQKNKSTKNQHILFALELLPEIELLESDGQKFYQVKFEFLSNARDRAFRILLEYGEPMYIDDITSEINTRLAHTDVTKIYNRHSLALAIDKRFKAMAKTGYWALLRWNTNTKKIEELVKTALYKLNVPSSAENILQEIIKERPNIKENSVLAIIGRDCLKVEGDLWILPEWRNRYSSISFAKRKKRINTKEPEYRIDQRAQVITYLKNKPARKAAATELIKAIGSKNSKFTKVSFYKIFEMEEYFTKTTVRSKLLIILKEQPTVSAVSVDQFNWKKVKEKLTRDLSPVFNSSNCPSYSFTFEDSLNLLHDAILFKSDEAELNGLSDRILGNLNKFYFTSSDSTDKLNYLKQFLTCLDPLFKKILLLVDIDNYNWVRNNNKGLGVVISKLDKIDPTNQRYVEDISSVTEANFGKEINSTYIYRNNDTHNANDWTETELIQAIINCFVVYVFSVSQYYIDLKEKIEEA